MTDDLKPTFTDRALGIPDFSDGTWFMQNKAGAIISSMNLNASPAATATTANPDNGYKPPKFTV